MVSFNAFIIFSIYRSGKGRGRVRIDCNDKDITGRIKEGYKEWDLRGAISVIVPIKCVLGN